MPSPAIWWGQTHSRWKEPPSFLVFLPSKDQESLSRDGRCCSLSAGSTPPCTLLPAVGDHPFSPPTRLTHDISLEEFEDEDLSEITDECGISLHCKESLATRVGTMAMGTGMGMGTGRACRWGWWDHQLPCGMTRLPGQRCFLEVPIATTPITSTRQCPILTAAQHRHLLSQPNPGD